MEYQATVTYCIPQIRNIKKYATRALIKAEGEIKIEVETSEEVELIEDLNYTFKKSYRIYRELLQLNDEQL